MAETLTTAGVWLMYTLAALLGIGGILALGLLLLLLRHLWKLSQRQAAIARSAANRMASIRLGARRGGAP
jgi:hypothetical protein